IKMAISLIPAYFSHTVASGRCRCYCVSVRLELIWRVLPGIVRLGRVSNRTCMICPGCKHQNLPEALFCSMCGKAITPSEGTVSSGSAASGPGPPLFYKDARPVPLKKGMAIASLVVGIVSILTLSCGMIGAIFGIVLGAMAHSKATKEPLEYGGKGIAT